MRVALLLLTLPALAAPFEFTSAPPEKLGLEPGKLKLLQEDLAKRGTKGLLILRRDQVALEWYGEGFSAEKPHYTASLAKALVGGVSLALAMEDQRLSPEDPVARFIPQWKNDARKSRITVAHLATHSSGLADAHEEGVSHEKLQGWKGEFWARKSTDPFTLTRDQVPLLFEPGEKTAYSNPGMAALSWCVTAALRGGDDKELRSLLRNRVMSRIGVDAKEWSVGYGQTYRVDGLDLVANWGGAAFTARATARVGRLFLREGDWQGQRVLSAATVRAVLDYRSTAQTKSWNGPAAPGPVLGWYANIDRTWPRAPRDAFCGAGAGHQILLVIPSLDLIVVRNGGLMSRDKDFWSAVEKHLVNPLLDCVSDPPMPPSEVIRKAKVGLGDTIVRLAPDSDNWPMTWAEDDAIYTAYGDGRGFAPFVERKLSNGLAKIEGTPEDPRPVNLRSESAERLGDGKGGEKASGLLAVDGVLHMFLRNAGNSQLLWSEDRGRNWSAGFKFDTSFGCPTLLNAGRNYSAAPEGYVYVYSPDTADAYSPGDGVVLARVAREKIRERGAYEFFAGADRWSRDIKDRRPVVAYPGHCERLDVIYNPGLKRYLMTMGYGHGNGWGLLDAPAPQGPWTLAANFTDSFWIEAQSHGYRLPTKWISRDGRQLVLIFSGRGKYDAWCQAPLTVQLYNR